jgi:hypothetical protein
MTLLNQLSTGQRRPILGRTRHKRRKDETPSFHEVRSPIFATCALLTCHRIKASGTVEKLTVLNSPAQAISVGSNDAHLTIDSVTVDNCELRILIRSIRLRLTEFIQLPETPTALVTIPTYALNGCVQCIRHLRATFRVLMFPLLTLQSRIPVIH